MEINDQNLAALGQYLQQTLSSNAETRKTAENFLRECEKEKGKNYLSDEALFSCSGYTLLLMTSMDRADTDLTIRTAAAITLKNVVKRCWDQTDKLSEDDRSAVKTHIVEVNRAPLIIFSCFFS